MIKLVVFDVDGTLTDGSIYIGDQGELCKKYYCRDGLAILFLHQTPMVPIVITSRKSQGLSNRMKELKVTKVYQNSKQKHITLSNICKELCVSLDEVAYIGDDINDYKAMKMCGIKMCPHDAQPEIKDICDYVALHDGGHGAVRDCLEFLFNKTGYINDFWRYYGCIE